jgi:hypothetical protein
MKLVLILFSILSVAQVCFGDEVPKYKMLDRNPYKNFNLCKAGGVLYQNHYVQATHLYEDFKKNNPSCKSKQTYAKGKLRESANEVHEIAKNLTNENKCPDLQRITREFLSNEKTTNEKIEDDLEKVKKMVAKDASRHKIQVEASFLAWGYHLCDAGFLGQSLHDRLDMLNKIKGLKFPTPPIQVKSEGDIIESCQNVSAKGPDVTKRFGVVTKNAPEQFLKLSYHTYTIKDHIRVVDKKGNILADTGCTQTYQTQQIDVNIVGKDIVYLEIVPDCEGTTSSDWHVHLSCGIPEPPSFVSKYESERRNYCKEKAKTMMEVIQENAELNFAGQQYRWIAANCYEEHYEKMAKTYTNMVDPKSFFSTSGSKKYTKQKAPLPANKESMKPLKYETLEIQARKPASPSPFVYDYDDFMRHKKRYCKKEPNEKMPIFKRISSAYCHYGLPRLFKPVEDSDTQL